MKKVYIAGAISSPILEQGLRNLRAGMLAGAEVLKMGLNPYVPHLNFQYSMIQDDEIDVEMFYKADLEWLKSCDCMLVLPGYKESKGVLAEIDFAIENNIPIIFDIETLRRLSKLSEAYQQVVLNGCSDFIEFLNGAEYE